MSDNPFASDENPYDAPQITVEGPGTGTADPGFGRTAQILRQTRPWVRFISVMLFICAGFMVLAGLFMLVLGGVAGGFQGLGAFAGLLYIVLALLYIVPAVHLWTYANRIDVFLRQQTTARLDSALESQKSFWRFIGIVMIVVLGIYALIIVVAVVGGLVATMR